MRSIFFIICALVFLPALFSPLVFADSINTDKKSYLFGDNLVISGTLSYSEGQFVGLQILNPSKSDIVLIDQFFPQEDGFFSKSYKVQGPKWTSNGIYTIKIAYSGQIHEKTFAFSHSETSNGDSNSGSVSGNDNSTKTNSNDFDSPSNPKFRVKGFPNPSNPPDYYYERYFSEKEYRDWFDRIFYDYSISEVVGYKPTHIDGFPNENKSPWYYVNRYYSEEVYRDWFDSQFPAKSIYDVIGYPESFFQRVPDWIKNNAGWWSSDLISDAEFFNGITYLINEGILIIPNLPNSEISDSEIVPTWVKQTCGWWAEGKIGENEFLKSIEFLVENGIIKV